MTGFPLSYRAHVSFSVKWSTMTLFTIGTAKLYNFLSFALPRHFRSLGLRLKTPELSANSQFMIYWQSPIHTSDPPIHLCLPHFRTGQFRLSVRVGIVQLGMRQKLKNTVQVVTELLHSLLSRLEIIVENFVRTNGNISSHFPPLSCGERRYAFVLITRG